MSPDARKAEQLAIAIGEYYEEALRLCNGNEIEAMNGTLMALRSVYTYLLTTLEVRKSEHK